MESPNLWNDVLCDLKKNINSQYVSTWLEPLRYVSCGNDRLSLSAPNVFHKDWVKNHYQDVIEDIVLRIIGKKVEINIEVSGSNDSENTKTKVKQPRAIRAQVKNESLVALPLNEKYSFENFVVGASSQFAHAASLACAENPGSNYNPLFIFGGSGLGKTHLLNAIGLKILKNMKGMRICYIRTENFVQELINALSHGKMAEFKNKYREQTDILLMDDIQILSGKEKSEEEFFHIFNTLYESKRQIVMTSDKYPKDMPKIEERLRSRLGWGLIADIQPPDMETRLAILKKKSEIEKINLPPDVEIFLATHIKDNVRDLEGALIRMAAYSSLTGADLSCDLAKKVLKNIINIKEKILTVEHIQKVVSNFFNITLTEIKSQRKKKSFAVPRQIAMYLSRKHTKSSFPELGNKFGGKDHSTILYASRKIEEQMKSDSKLKNTIESIEKSLDS